MKHKRLTYWRYIATFDQIGHTDHSHTRARLKRLYLDRKPWCIGEWPKYRRMLQPPAPFRPTSWHLDCFMAYPYGSIHTERKPWKKLNEYQMGKIGRMS